MLRKVQLELTSDEALVLFDWLARFNEADEAIPKDDAEERVLFDLEASLEKTLVAPLAANYKEELESAKAGVLLGSSETT